MPLKHQETRTHNFRDIDGKRPGWAAPRLHFHRENKLLGTAGGAKRVSGSAGFDDKGGEGMHWGVGVLDRARKLHLRAPLLGGGIAVHEATVAQVEVPSSK